VPVRSAPDTASAQPLQYPRLVKDPLASLRLAPVEVVLPHAVAIVPAMTAGQWLEVLSVGSQLWLDDVVPGLCEDPQVVEDALWDGDVTPDDVGDLALDVVSAAAGRPWWVAMSLIMVAWNNWDALGPELSAAVDADRVPLGAWLDVLLPIIVNHMERSAAQMFLLRLETPPPSAREEAVVEIPADAFLAMM
jgi:hypothetical protein